MYEPSDETIVPAGEDIGIVDIAARHAGQAEEVLREEDDVHADELQPEMQLADRFRVHVAGDLREPVVPGAEDGEDRAKRQHIVEVGDHIVGVMQRAVDAGIGEDHAGDAADGKQEDEADAPTAWAP